MNLLYVLLVALIAGCGVHMLLSRNAVRLVLGLSLLSTAVNLAIFLTGRPGTDQPPLIAPGQTALAADAAQSLPQALVLTAIVIGFALTAFLAALVLRARGVFGTVDGRGIGAGPGGAEPDA